MWVEKKKTNLKQIEKNVYTFSSLFWFILIYQFVSIIIIITYKYLCNFYMLEKHWIFIENANSESLTLVLCSFLI